MNLVNLEQIVNFISGNVFWKDKHHRYLGCNASMAALPAIIEVRSGNDILGKTTHDLLPNRHADAIQKNDTIIIQQNVSRIIEEEGLNVHSETTLFLSQKMPLYDADSTVSGLMGVSVDIAQLESKNRMNALKKNNKQMFSLWKETSDHKKKQFIQAHNALKECQIPPCYLLGEYNDTYLSKREFECLRYTVQGRSAKEIGKILALSPRTIEFHIKKIKIKFKCRTILELIARLAPTFKA